MSRLMRGEVPRVEDMSIRDLGRCKLVLEKELGELGYTCKLPASAACYKPIHAILEGTVRRQDEAYLAHLRKTGVAFVPKTYSNCRKFGLESNRASADDDGVAIFWREDVFRATAIDFLSFDDAKRNQVSLS